MLLKARCGWWIILRKQRSTNMPWWQRNSASDVSIITTWQLCCRLWFPYLCCCLCDWGTGAIHLRVLWLPLCPLTLCWWFWLTENNQGWLFFSCSSFFSLASSLCVREAKITKKKTSGVHCMYLVMYIPSLCIIWKDAKQLFWIHLKQALVCYS